jgi:DNA-binding transcriptional LysR family regulator
MSHLDQIEAFIQVVEKNSFTRAAKSLGISAAAVSKQINALEKRLAVQLLVRSTRKIELTDVGTNYYHQCQRILIELNEADSLVSQIRKEPSGILRIVASNYYAERYVIPHLAEFMSLFPKVELHIELAERFPDLVQENIDVLVGTSLEGPPELIRRKICSGQYVLCATQTYLEKYGMPKKPVDLLHHRYIEHSMRRPFGIINFKNDQSVTVKPILFLNSTKEMISCALNDIGIIKLHHYALEDLIQSQQLVEILPEYRDIKRNVYLFYQASRFVQPKIRHFIDFVMKKMGME